MLLLVVGCGLGILDYFMNIFVDPEDEAGLRQAIQGRRQQAPVPVFWLFGKTQSGKTSLIRYLTGAEDAEIGSGFKPTTRFTRRYQFPTEDAPLLTFLDTRGLDEPSYDPTEDLQKFHNEAHAMVVTVRATDHALENVVNHLRRIRQAEPQRPVLLVVTCLHEAYPQQQHPLPYPFENGWDVPASAAPEALIRSLAEQRRRFEGLADRYVAVDLTKPEEGFNDPNYGGEILKQALIEILPDAYRQTLIRFEDASKDLRDWYERRAQPYIISYSLLAGSFALVPLPLLELPAIVAVQVMMARKLAQLYGLEFDKKRFWELAGALGMGVIIRQIRRELAKVIPYVGSVLAAAFAAASTYALGRAFCYYYSAVLKGHVPKAEDIRKFYDEELKRAERYWKTRFQSSPEQAGSSASSSQPG